MKRKKAKMKTFYTVFPEARWSAGGSGEGAHLGRRGH